MRRSWFAVRFRWCLNGSLATVRLTEGGDGVTVDWHIELASKVPFVAQAVGYALRRSLPGALKYFASTFDAAQPPGR